MWSCTNHSSARPQSSFILYFGRVSFVAGMKNRGYGGLHSAGFVNAGLSLKVPSGLEFQAFVGAFRDTGAAAESLLKTSAKPKKK